jgi:hypothetical protein
MKNITLAMVTVLAVVAMLSAVLAVPMQQASASDGDGNSIKINQRNECEDTMPNSCQNSAEVGAEQIISED